MPSRFREISQKIKLTSWRLSALAQPLALLVLLSGLLLASCETTVQQADHTVVIPPQVLLEPVPEPSVPPNAENDQDQVALLLLEYQATVRAWEAKWVGINEWVASLNKCFQERRAKC